jgi:hypothetical protein
MSVIAKIARKGDFKERALKSEWASRHVLEYRRKKLAADAYCMMGDFEKHLKTLQGPRQNSVQEPELDLPIGAEAGAANSRERLLSQNWDSSDSDSDMEQVLHGSRSAPDLLKRTSAKLSRSQHDLDDELHARRPPSPLSIYDYGNISMKPKSALTQHREHAGMLTRPRDQAASSCGFYFPGSDFKRGPYGFSMLDPIFMPPRAWEPCREVPEIPAEHPNAITGARPSNAADVAFRRRSCASKGAVPRSVQAARGQLLRSKHVAASMEHNRVNANLEHSQFENGTCGGRWQHPGVERIRSSPPIDGIPDHSRTGPTRDQGGPQALAYHILFGILRALRENHSTLPQLFRAVTRGPPGTLSLEDFVEGLAKLHVLGDDIATKNMVDAMLIIDPTFDGYVYFPALKAALKAAGVRHRQTQECSSSLHGKITCPERINAMYSETLPVDVVKVDKRPKSLHDFERQASRFRMQQSDLVQLGEDAGTSPWADPSEGDILEVDQD